MIATVHTGPKGGVEYRLWNESGETYRIVSRFVAWPNMSPDERESAERLESARREAKHRKAEANTAWRKIMRGG